MELSCSCLSIAGSKQELINRGSKIYVVLIIDFNHHFVKKQRKQLPPATSASHIQ